MTEAREDGIARLIDEYREAILAAYTANNSSDFADDERFKRREAARSARQALEAALRPPTPNGEGVLPCPFCGTQPYIVLNTGLGDYHDEDCPLASNEYETDAEAIAAWNRRAGSAPPASQPKEG